ncbi:MAG: hypothetical protein AABX79_02460 [Nanoarchaeota archaeon]
MGKGLGFSLIILGVAIIFFGKSIFPFLELSGWLIPAGLGIIVIGVFVAFPLGTKPPYRPRY